MEYCKECKVLVERPKRYRESWGEEFSVCPYCGGDLVEYAICTECRKPCAAEDTEDGLCPDCRRKTEKVFKSIMESFSENQRKYLNDFYDGRHF